MILETERLELVPLLPRQLREWVENIPALEQELRCSYKAEPLEGFFLGIVKGQLEITEQNPKLREGVISLLSLDNRFASALFDFTEPYKIDILDFLENNYMYDLSLSEIAFYTGRSVASFKRDFRKISPLPPPKWIMQKRLNAAYDKIRQEGHG